MALGLGRGQTLQGFAPVAEANCRILILGSMPGKVSLRANEYYAFPRNAFWRIMQEVFALQEGLTYKQRTQQLTRQKIALWDVLKHCERESSLDADIVEESTVPNDLKTFFRKHPKLERVLFNGQTAQSAFEKHVRSSLPAPYYKLDSLLMPSTSPANTSLRFAEKLERWRVGLGRG